MIDMNDLYNIIKNCDYIKKCQSNKNKDIDSFSYLITDIILSQSDCIKLGNGFEKIMRDIILKYNNNICDIKPKNIKGNKEKDHLFCDEKQKIIYYAEFKTNLNLDTEKSKSTYNKCQDIVKELQDEYKDYQIKWCLLGCRYINKTNIKKIIINKYMEIFDNVYGINDYLELLDIPFIFNDLTYKEFVNKIAIEMFKDK